MTFRKFLLPAFAALALTAGTGAAASAATVHHRTVHRTVTHRGHRTIVRTTVNNRTVVRRPGRRVFITRDRAWGVFRARGIRIVGTPYIYGGAYVVRCYDPRGRLAYCRVDPYTGSWLGITLHL